MKKLPIIISLFFLMSALFCSISSYHKTEVRIYQDVNNALKMTQAEMPCDVVSPDTIRCYRNFLTIPELKERACIAMRTTRRDGKQETEMIAQANCDFLTILLLSDQKHSCLLTIIGLLGMFGSLWYMRKHKLGILADGLTYGGIIYANNKFMTSKGKPIRLTPMQHTLLEMFMESESHCLSKQEICDRLWPKKPDANDTLYTLIRRIKPIIEENSNLKIESDRGRSYSLEFK